MRRIWMPIAILGCCPSVHACKAPANTAQDPAALCAAPSTADGLAHVAYGEDTKANDVKLALDNPVLDSTDSTTHRTTCLATFNIRLTGMFANVKPEAPLQLMSFGLVGADGPSAVELLKLRQTYSIQPAADGKGTVYTLPSETVAALRTWIGAVELAATKAQPASPEQANPGAAASTGGPAGANAAEAEISPQAGPSSSQDASERDDSTDQDTPEFKACSAKAETQSDSDECVNQELGRQTSRINSIYLQVMRSQRDPQSQLALKRSERAWIKRRDDHCRVEGDDYKGGSMQGEVIGECLIRETEKRIEELRSAAPS